MAGERTYSRIAGHVVLDLINTVSWRLDDAERTDDLERRHDRVVGDNRHHSWC